MKASETTAPRLNKAEFFKAAHAITKGRCKKYYGSYAKAFAIVLKELYASGGLVWAFNC